MRIRQIALVAREMQPVREALYELLGVDAAYIDPKIDKFGLQNIVMTVGDTFLEVVCPVQEGTTAGRLLDRRGGDGGYMVIVQVDDLAAEKERLAATDIETVWEADIGHAKAIHLHPRDVPGAIASLDQMDPPEAWYWAGTDWNERTARNAGNIVAAEVQSGDPKATAAKWSLAYDHPIDDSAGMPTMNYGTTSVRFVAAEDGRGTGLRAIDIEAIDRDAIFSAAERLGLQHDGDTVTVCGTAINFV
ncbi:MAG: hypothetical protein AAFN50_04995 [Pseudomonadota bacterium]